MRNIDFTLMEKAVDRAKYALTQKQFGGGFDESKIRRNPRGGRGGGQFAPKGGAGNSGMPSIPSMGMQFDPSMGDQMWTANKPKPRLPKGWPVQKAFDESKIKRHAKGSAGGGRFAPKGGASNAPRAYGIPRPDFVPSHAYHDPSMGDQMYSFNPLNDQQRAGFDRARARFAGRRK